MSTLNADLLSLIHQAHAENWEELDLSGRGLTELPQEIDRLTGLKKLGDFQKYTYPISG
jgi:Leucine-rich repeat (LRR) protein